MDVEIDAMVESDQIKVGKKIEEDGNAELEWQKVTVSCRRI